MSLVSLDPSLGDEIEAIRENLKFCSMFQKPSSDKRINLGEIMSCLMDIEHCLKEEMQAIEFEEAREEMEKAK